MQRACDMTENIGWYVPWGVLWLRGSLILPAGMDGAVEVFAIRIGSLVQVVLVNRKENDESLKQMHAS